MPALNHEWVSSETPPQEIGQYLVNHQTRYSNVPWVNRVIPASWDGKRWQCYGQDYYLCEFVTHWMPFPLSPFELCQH
jgi:hypothetical protein